MLYNCKTKIMLWETFAFFYYRRSVCLDFFVLKGECATLKMPGSGFFQLSFRKGKKTLCIPELLVSNQARGPAELKHINKRRKRNQQGFP